MRLRQAPFVVGILTLCLASFARAGLPYPVIESVGGDKDVSVVSGANVKKAQVGQGLSAGDRVKTSAFSSTIIRLPDGSRLLVGHSSEYEVGQVDTSGIPWHQLRGGTMRGMIEKKHNQRLEPGKKPPLKLGVRARSVVMGVRGTDFVLQAGTEAQPSRIFTLEGTVEAAPNENALVAGQGMPVPDCQFVSASDTGGLQSPRKFDCNQVRRRFDSDYPDSGFPGAQAAHGPWLRFRGFGAYLSQTQPSTTTLTTGGVAWIPELSVWKSLSVMLQLSAYAGKEKTDAQTIFPAFEGGVYARYAGLPWRLKVEAGAGAAYWPGERLSTSMVFGGGVSRDLEPSWAPWLNHAFLTVSKIAHSELPTLQARVGVGVSF